MIKLDPQRTLIGNANMDMDSVADFSISNGMEEVASLRALVRRWMLACVCACVCVCVVCVCVCNVCLSVGLSVCLAGWLAVRPSV